MSERCYRCWRTIKIVGSERQCLCRYVTEIDSGVLFVFLMHPKERRHQRTGTGQLAHISLAASLLFVGLDFALCAPFMALLHDKRYYPVLLYPGDEGHPALTAQSPQLAQALIGANASDAAKDKAKQLLVIVIDGTWFCSRKVIEHNKYLLDLPRLSFAGKYSTEYRFKKEPRAECVSTIESCYYIIKELQAAGLANADANPDPLMSVFRQMVQDQIDAQNARVAGLLPNTHAYDWKYTNRFNG